MELMLTGCRLIDGTGVDPVDDAALYVRDGRITWAGPAANPPADAAGAPHEDLSGQTVIPGLIDAHVHLSWNGRAPAREIVRRDRDRLLVEALATARDILASGTTAVRDLGGHAYLEMAVRWGIEAGYAAGPRIRAAGKPIAMTGGHGYYLAREADGPDEVRKAAREQLKAGADTVKLMATGGVATPGQDVQATQLTIEELAAAIDVAHTQGRATAAHCHGTAGIKNAVLAGIDSIEHGSYLDEETADLMVERDTALTLTLSVANPDTSTLSEGAWHEVTRIQPALDTVRARMRESVVLARARGVFIGAGTDAGGSPTAPHDFSVARELHELVDYGFSPLEALGIVTRNNARILRWDRDLGTLEPGKRADFVVLGADPLDDIDNVREITAVYKDGRRVV